MRSKLPNSVLRRIWNLSDIDQDGMLDRDEFAVAMFLIDHKLGGNDIPEVLPDRLVPPSKVRYHTRRREGRGSNGGGREESHSRSHEYSLGGNSSVSHDASYARDSGYGRDASYGGESSYRRGGGGGYDDGGGYSMSRGRQTDEYDEDSHLSSFIDRAQ